MPRVRDLRRPVTAVLVAGPFAWAVHDTVTTSADGLAAAESGAWWAWPGSVLVAILAGAVLAGYLVESRAFTDLGHLIAWSVGLALALLVRQATARVSAG